MTLKCIHTYKSEAPELLFIYDANIGISVSLIILLFIGIFIIIICCDSNVNNHNNDEGQDIENIGISDNIPAEEISINDNSNNPNITKCCVCLSSYDKILACVPCGHVCVCRKCFKTGNIQKCPVCLQQITGQMKVYLI